MPSRMPKTSPTRLAVFLRAVPDTDEARYAAASTNYRIEKPLPGINMALERLGVDFAKVVGWRSERLRRLKLLAEHAEEMDPGARYQSLRTFEKILTGVLTPVVAMAKASADTEPAA